MQELAASMLADPAYLAGVGTAALVLAAVWVLRTVLNSRTAGDPLEGLFDRSTLDRQLDHVALRPRPVLRCELPNAPAHFHGQRAQMARLNEVWERDTRDEAISEVARVLRMGQESSPVPVRVLAPIAAVEEAEWEEIRLLPPPPATKRA